ncbi:MAG TPA: sigma-54 dependent transcriptional regulator [Kiritimatiellia bacterium]|nr:sigma-54 dependent transcriptional regulator [Kiritimatiellia bacterium]HPS06968.1 sigma-54 dependent transcriptional regulator [Kiritimatiellia bacterium]
MNDTPTLLIIEDDPDNARSVTEAAEDAGFKAVCTTTGTAGVDAFRQHVPDLVLSDLVLPDIDGLEVLARLRKLDAAVPVIIMTAYGSVESGVRAIHEGAYDYVTKPLDLDDIQSKLRRAYETSRLRRQVDKLSQSVREKFAATAIIAESAGMKAVITQIEALADTTATVLVTGESGTGKELVARALHVDSKRADGPFVAVNCGAFAETLLESELFGHEKGSFTGAVGTYKGAFERADGGTLFLDEIGDAPASVQVKLLRALEEKEVRRVGGKEVFKVNVRLVSATNKDLVAMVKEGTFREDLLYRLNVVTLRVPPLRSRKEDIRHMADRFIARAASENGKHITTVRPDFYAALESYDWPGNVRQLRNIVESAVLLSPGGVLTADSVALPGGASARATPAAAPGALSIPDGMTLEQLERAVLETRLQQNSGNRTLTADQLGLSRRTIQRKIKEHNLPY